MSTKSAILFDIGLAASLHRRTDRRQPFAALPQPWTPRIRKIIFAAIRHPKGRSVRPVAAPLRLRQLGIFRIFINPSERLLNSQLWRESSLFFRKFVK